MALKKSRFSSPVCLKYLIFGLRLKISKEARPLSGLSGLPGLCGLSGLFALSGPSGLSKLESAPGQNSNLTWRSKSVGSLCEFI